MKKRHDESQMKQPPSLPVPTSPGSETVAQLCLEEGVPSPDQSRLITGIGRVQASDRILCHGWSILQNGALENEESTMPGLQQAMELLLELRTGNATEAMLAVQMLGTHEAAVKFLNSALLEGQTSEAMDANVLRAQRVMRLFVEQLSAMAKLKGKIGQQKVTVEHVHVNAGGQAIVGHVAANPQDGSR